MPTLVYHGTPRLHPEAGSSAAAGLDLGPPQWGSSASTSGGIAAIRFPRPVRLSQLRVVPAGVVHPTGVG
jgi:hypothetical protein